MLRKVLDFSSVAPAYVHEWFHYITARMLGLPARVEIDAKRHIARCKVSAEDWQHALIALAPAVIGTPVLALAWIWLLQLDAGSPVAQLVVFIAFEAAWLLGCLGDFKFVNTLLQKH